MTEAEWLTCADPELVLAVASERTSNRKLRLIAVGCWRSFPFRPESGEWEAAVGTVERYADGLSTPGDLAALTTDRAATQDGGRHNVQPADVRLLSVGLELLSQANDWSAADAAVRYATGFGSSFARGTVYKRLENIPAVLGLLRCVVGNPFRHAVVGPAWLTSTVVLLARQVYESRDFSPMPILADALQDAGCDNDDILTHCREAVEHVRGCWVIDLLLGKA